MKNKLLNIRYELLVMVVLVIVTACVYLPVKDHDFVEYDDNVYLAENPYVRGGFTSENLKWAFTAFHAGNWHPVTWISHMLDVQLFGLKPGRHHIVNLLLHIANTLLLFLVFHRMTKTLWQSAFVAAVFALHPLHVESVAWVAERKDVLSTFFWLLTMGAYLFYVEKPEWKRYFPALLFFALGLMAKPMLVTLPFVLLLLDYWPLGRVRFTGAVKDIQADMPKQGNHKKRKLKSMQGSIKQASPGKLPGFFFRWSSIRPLILEKAPFFVLAAVSSIITYIAQQKGGAVEDLQYLSLPARLANAVISYCSYIGKAIWPADLAVLYPHPGMLPPWQVLGAVLLLTVITLLVIYAAKQFPYLAVGWLWYLGTLIPVIGIVQVGVQAMADRYTYVPLIGVLIMIAWGVPDLLGRWRYRMIALTVPAIVILLVFTFVTWKQVHYWQDTVTLFRRALAVTANNYVAHYNFGNSLQDQGKLEEAVSHYFEALRIHPNYADAHNNLGAVLQEQGYFQEAVNHYSEALRINPNYGNAYNNLGFALQEQGRYKEAFAHYSEALRINPHSAGAHSNMGDLLMIQGKTEEAIGHYHEAIRLRPDYMKTYINWGEKLAAQGKYNEAAELYERALRIKPDSAEIHYNMGTMLAARGDMDEAIAHLRETVRIKPDYAKAHNNLGNALLIQGKIDEAIYSFRQALHLKPDYRMAQENLRDALILQKKSR